MEQVTLGEKIAEIRLNPLRTNLAGLLVAVIVALLFWLLAVRLAGDWNSSWQGYLIALALFLPMGAIHELSHGVTAMLCGRLRWRDIRFGIHWKAISAVCHIKAPLRVSSARIVGLAPLVITGPLAVALLLAFPREVTVMLASFAVVGCYADVCMLYRLREFHDPMWIVDHPTEPGFDVYAPADG
jgi:hypothetical protein